MKKVLYGLLAGVVLCGAAYFLVVPKIEKKSYENGYTAGNKTGVEIGTSAGIEQGMKKLEAMQQQQQAQEQQLSEKKHQSALRAAHRAAKAEPSVQNWHVRGDKIAEPIEEQPTAVK